ncbi:MAG: agmatinase [Actinomycetota bacterium]
MTTGLATFGRRAATRDLVGVDIAVLGVPYGVDTPAGSGARGGPPAIREQSLFVGQDARGHWPWDFTLWDAATVVDWGDVVASTPWAGSPEAMVADTRRAVATIVAAGASPLVLGGDHSVSYPVLAALAERHGPLSLVHFDAHSDTWDRGDELGHGTVFRVAARDGLVDPSRSVQVGMRTAGPSDCGFAVVDADALLDRPLTETVAEIRSRVGDRSVYVSLDIDFLDPAFAPGTGTPVVGGPSTRDARRLLHGLAGLRVVGADHVEVAPDLDATGSLTAITAATLAVDLAHLLALGRRS